MIQVVFLIEDALQLENFRRGMCTSGIVIDTSIVNPSELRAAALSPYDPTNFIEDGVSNLYLYNASFGGGGFGKGT